MRRFLALIAVPLLACLVLAACGGSSKSTASSSSSATSSGAASPGDQVSNSVLEKALVIVNMSGHYDEPGVRSGRVLFEKQRKCVFVGADVM